MNIILYDHAHETFAIQFLAATLRRDGHAATVYFDCSLCTDLDQRLFHVPFFSLSEAAVAEAILAESPDLVGFSLLTAMRQRISGIIRCLKARRPELIIVVGGPHATLLPASVLQDDAVDFVCVGDADLSFPALLRHLQDKPPGRIRELPDTELPGIATRSNGHLRLRGLGPVLESLDNTPFPFKEPYYRKNPALRSLYTTTASRGCRFACTYCNSNNLRQRYQAAGQQYFRVCSVDRLMRELRFARDTYRPRQVMFLDSLFAPDPAWLREFAAAYRRDIGLPFYCETNPAIHTPESVDLLADAGCTLLQFGLQSTVEEVRRSTLHRYETNDRVRALISRARERRIFVLIDHIACLPGETRADLEAAVDFYRATRPNWVNLAYLQYLPQAEIVDIAIQAGAIPAGRRAAIDAGDGLTAIRLLPKTRLTPYYRTLALRLFCAFRLPPRTGAALARLLDRSWCALLASPWMTLFIYLSRIFCAYTDRRDFFIRHHVQRNLHAMRAVCVEKYRRRHQRVSHG